MKRNNGEIGVSKHFFAEFCLKEPLLLREVRMLQKSVKAACGLGKDTWKRCRQQRKELIGTEGAGEDGGALDQPGVFTSFRRFNHNLARGLYTHSPEAEVEDNSGIYPSSSFQAPLSDHSSKAHETWKCATTSSQQQCLTLADFSPSYSRRSRSRQASYSTADGDVIESPTDEKESVKAQLKKAQRHVKSISRQGSVNTGLIISRHNSASSVASVDSGFGGRKGYMDELNMY